MNPDSPKDHAARAGAAMVRDGMIVGLGSGTTAERMVHFLAGRIAADGLDFTAVATSEPIAALARRLGIRVLDLDEVDRLDISLDGADEIDRAFRMIKGRGGALLREKIVARASGHSVIMVSPEKLVERLGGRMPIPVEVSSFGLRHTERLLHTLKATTAIRRGDDGTPYRTDGGNAIVDCHFDELDDPAAMDRELQRLPGVLETGLFLGLCQTLIVGGDEGVEVIEGGAAMA